MNENGFGRFPKQTVRCGLPPQYGEKKTASGLKAFPARSRSSDAGFLGGGPRCRFGVGSNHAAFPQKR